MEFKCTHVRVNICTNTDPLQRFVASLMLPISLLTVSAFLELAALTDCCTAIGTIFSNRSKQKNCDYLHYFIGFFNIGKGEITTPKN